ncbi:MAG: relaxase/mobilization nuclease domain-containing protein [Erysipelotrichaceae bacterium]|nr:relaxase/mobilization nuclease domain-containing protein [Erysipelotrichaceae bacterium]
MKQPWDSTKGKHAFTVSTHTDRTHIHYHIIFNSTTRGCTRKFKNFFYSGLALQHLSDIICLEHGYSIIEKKPYADRSKRTVYPKRHTMRNELGSVIDSCLKQNPENLNAFYQFLPEHGYELKYGKHPDVEGRRQKKFIRLDSLGEDYTQDAISERIAGANVRELHHDGQSLIPDLLIDIENRILGKGRGYERWAKKKNLGMTVDTLRFLQKENIHSMTQLWESAESAVQRCEQLKADIRSRETRLSEIKELKTHIINYSKTRETYKQYREAGYSKKFLETHREEIMLHKAAKESFGCLPNGKIPKIKDLNSEYQQLIQEKQKLYAEYRKAKERMKAMENARKNAEMILGKIIVNMMECRNKRSPNAQPPT